MILHKNQQKNNSKWEVRRRKKADEEREKIFWIEKLKYVGLEWKKSMGMRAGGKEKQEKSSTLDLINTIMHFVCGRHKKKEKGQRQAVVW